MSVVTYFPGSIDVYDPAMNWLGTIGNPISIEGSIKFNGLSAFTIVVAADDQIVSDLLTEGARITMIYRDRQIFSGPIVAVRGSLLLNGTVEIDIESDWRILTNTVAWIRPLNQLEATTISVKNASSTTAEAQSWLPGGASTQGTSGTVIGQTGYYYWDPAVVYAETAIKRIIQENCVTRLGRPMTIATDLGRGGDIKTPGLLPTFRMARLDDVVNEILALDGLGLTVQQATRTTTIGVDVYVPGVWDMPLTASSGVISGGSWSISTPHITRALLGGPGDMAARQFLTVNDTTGLEAQYHDIIEVFRDASSAADLIWPEGVTVEEGKVPKYYELRSDVSAANKAAYRASMIAAGELALEEGRPMFGISAELSETDSFHFGGSDGIQLGDQVTIQGLGGALYTDKITECQFQFGDGTFNVKPIVGTRSDDPDTQLAQAIGNLAAAQRRLSADK